MAFGAGGLIEGRKIRALEKLLEELPEKYLLGEVLPKPMDGVEKRYFLIMQEMSRSAVGIAEQALQEKEEYCDYVESWIHEIKTPLTACSLILSNGGDADKLRRELKRADNLTESILYYARLRTAQNDVKIKEFSVAEVVEEAVKSQLELLIAAGISIDTEGNFVIGSDRKILCFILKQLLINCAKYCPGCKVRITAKNKAIHVWDNGPGIPAHELPRVTQRGFTGSGAGKGWEAVRSSGAGNDYKMKPEGGTGMGLYIVRELCTRLGIDLEIRSVQREFTCVSLTFSLD